MSAPQSILDLVVRFEQQLDAYKSGAYNETQLRRDFLDPLFKALGWDMDNEAGYAEAYRDVIHEDAIRIGGAVKAPDYCFRIGGTRKFFLEAKKPSVFIKQEIPPAYQLRRYAWSAKLPLSILSDFEELAVYDCRVKPGKDDPASTARVFYCTFRELAEKWDWLASVFSRDAVLKGSFDKFAETNKAKRGTTEVDADFLASMETWRNDLAKNLALRNPRLSQRELNFAVQRILDRIIFLRICEDRGLEDYGRLQALTNGGRIYPRLCQHFEQADTRYNSGIFHFKPEKDRHEPPDELTLGLDVDDTLLRDLFKGLYYPDSPYEFSVLSADILGQVYEQFLGKVIRLTEGHRAVVDEKPEVRKAGGVYYTPTYVADYIVRQTVGRLVEEIFAKETGRAGAPTFVVPASAGIGSASSRALESASTRPAEAGTPNLSARAGQRVLDRVAQLRILDPACGSGSFLICAYQFLLDWHLQFYLATDPVRWAKGKRTALVQTTRGWRLTIAERKRILLNNIYGVDIDPQAVEVTKLSLLLKVLEGETSQSIAPLFSMFHERALPDLGDNIKCGNSLIGPDFYDSTAGTGSTPSLSSIKSQGRGGTRPYQPALFELNDEEKHRLNVFDWHTEFPHIFRRRNPRDELRETAAASPLDYTMPGAPLHGSYSYKKKKSEKTVPPPAPIEPEWEGGFDAVIGNPPYVRIQRISHAESDYLFRSYESPTSKMDLSLVFMEQALRLSNKAGRAGFICTSQWLSADYGRNLRRMLSKGRLHQIVDFGSLPVFEKANTYPAIFVLSPKQAAELLVKRISSKDQLNLAAIEGAPTKTVALASLTEAPWTLGGLDVAAILERGKLPWKPLREFGKAYIGCKTGMNEAFVLPRQEAKRLKLENRILFPYAYRGEEVSRYGQVEPDAVVIYPYREDAGGQPKILSEVDLRSQFPNIHAFLSSFKADLRKRQDSRRLYADGPDWFRHLRPGTFNYIRRPKLVFKAIAKESAGGILAENTAFDGANCPAILVENLAGHDLRYLLAVLNSKLLSKHLRQVCPPKLSDYVKFSATCLSDAPIRFLDLSTASDRAMHNRMVSLVEQMLGLHRQVALARTPHEQTALERQIAATDTQIDRLVYQLYGLTQEEIQIVEGTTQ